MKLNFKDIDKPTFIATFVILLAICIPLMINPVKGSIILNKANEFTINNFGVFYIWVAFASVIFLAIIAFSSYGDIFLGDEGEKPRFSDISWASMLFCAGIGASVMYWGSIEWAYYYQAPPFGIAPKSVEAAEWAAAYGIFHWGITAWAIYIVPALPIAYLYYVRKKPILKISEACRPVLGDKVDGILGTVIDVLFMFGLIGGAGTTLGLGTPMIASGIEKITGITRNLTMDLIVLFICTVIFAISAYSGLDKGIKWLSNLNLGLLGILLLFVLIFGSTLFILKMGTNSIGIILDNVVRMNTYTDPVGQSGFPENWTVFYWAWWIVYAPFIGLFVAKISKGRTIKQMILGSVLYGTAGCALVFIILGNYTMYLEINNIVPIIDILNEQGAPAAIMAMLGSLPFPKFITFIFTLTALIFLATTFDSSSYSLAAVTQKRVVKDPERWNRLFWAFSLAILPVALMLVGGLKPLQTASILVALPLILVMIIMSISFVKMVKADREKNKSMQSNVKRLEKKVHKNVG